MTLNKFILLSFSLLLISCSKSNEIILDAYSCLDKPKNTYSDEFTKFMSCSNSCKKMTRTNEDGEKISIKLGYITNVNDKTVLEKTYRNNVVLNSEVYKNCTIFNNENWDCSHEISFRNLYDQYFTKMNNKVFVSYSIKKTYGVNNIEELQIGHCAK